ncbi:MAG: hypothetical protein IJS15_13125 [Victivallales bacterium]|nr:hypothetical protein [Victivallales bacterium]
MDCKEIFNKLYEKDSEYESFCPYRVCPVGAHIDHQLGKITGFAIDKGIRMAYTPRKDGEVDLASMNFEGRRSFNVNAVPKSSLHDWADHLRGATIALAKAHPLSVGLNGVLEGSLPVGGLSSSAAVIICFLKALCQVNGITLPPHEMILTAQHAENEYVGVSCGKLDQSCEVLCRKGQLLYLDTRDDSFDLLPKPKSMRPFRIAIFFSGLERSLVGQKYNMRVDEVKSAGYALLAYAGADYGKFGETFMRDVPEELFTRYGDRLPETWRRRALHYFSEMHRVEQAVTAWRNGDIAEFGRISFESGQSSIEFWETGSEELKAMYEIMRETDGIYGGRFSGAGFQGCCMALIDPDYEESICKNVTEKYLKRFPALAEKYRCCVCDTADGAII